MSAMVYYTRVVSEKVVQGVKENEKSINRKV